MYNLPIELATEIMGYVGRDLASLASVRLVSRVFQSAAAPSFFHTINLRDYTRGAHALSLFQALVTHSYAGHVHHLRASWDPSDASASQSEIICAVVDALRLMKNLETLRLATSCTNNNRVETFLAQATPYWPKLVDFRIQGIVTASFLQRHQNLRVLFVEGLIADSYEALHLPRLEALGFNEDGDIFFQSGLLHDNLVRMACHEDHTLALHSAARVARNLTKMSIRSADILAFAHGLSPTPMPFARVHTLHVVDMDNPHAPDLVIADMRIVGVLRTLFPRLVALNVMTHGFALQSLRVAAAVIALAEGPPRVLPFLKELRIGGVYTFVWDNTFRGFVSSTFVRNIKLLELEV